MKLEEIARPVGLRPSATYLGEVEALRGWAVVLVVASHFLPWIGEGSTGSSLSFYALLAGGHTGVSLFFLLSAFLLSQPFLEQMDGGRRVAIGDFYRRRALRILPLYYAAVLVAVALSYHSLAQPGRTLAYLAFLQRLPGVPVMNPYSDVWWSLCTEIQFYALLPLLPFVSRPGLGRLAGGAALLLYAAAFAATVWGRIHWGPPPFLDSHSLYGRAPLFACGIAAAWLYRRHGARFRRWAAASRAVRAGAADLALLLALMALGLLLRRVEGLGYFVAEAAWPAWHVYEGSLWGFILWLLLTVPLRSKVLVCNASLRTLGVLSYSIYMVHYPLVGRVWDFVCLEQPLACRGWNVRTAGVTLVYAATLLAISAASYALIERPFLLRKGRAAG